jgi:hypothetical protein
MMSTVIAMLSPRYEDEVIGSVISNRKCLSLTSSTWNCRRM